jgi:hypothetical protein
LRSVAPAFFHELSTTTSEADLWPLAGPTFEELLDREALQMTQARADPAYSRAGASAARRREMKTIRDIEDFRALDPFFRIIEQGLEGLVDGSHFFDLLAEDVVFEFIITVPDYPRQVVGRDNLIELYRGYGSTFFLDRCHDLRVHRSEATSTVVLEYASRESLRNGRAVQQPIHLRHHAHRSQDLPLARLSRSPSRDHRAKRPAVTNARLQERGEVDPKKRRFPALLQTF